MTFQLGLPKYYFLIPSQASIERDVSSNTLLGEPKPRFLPSDDFVWRLHWLTTRETRHIRRNSRWWNWYINPIVPDVNACIDHGASKFSIRTSWAAAHGDNGGHSRKDQTIHPSAIEPRTPISFPTSANSASSTPTSHSLGALRCRLLLCGGLRKLVHDGLLDRCGVQREIATPSLASQYEILRKRQQKLIDRHVIQTKEALPSYKDAKHYAYLDAGRLRRRFLHTKMQGIMHTWSREIRQQSYWLLRGWSTPLPLLESVDVH